VKIGDRVRHKTRREVVGTVVSFGKYNSVLVDLSYASGIMFRKFRIISLEVVENEKDCETR